jgi:hypothetical protein
MLSMSIGEMSGSVRALLERLAATVTVRTTSTHWHVEEVPATSAHAAEVMLIFTSPVDPTVEEVAVTVALRDDPSEWDIDVIDREGLPLLEAVEWHADDGSEAALEVLSRAVASLEDRIVGTLEDLRPGS